MNLDILQPGEHCASTSNRNFEAPSPPLPICNKIKLMLQIGIGTRASPVPHSDQPSLFLDDDGYYWFLSPLFTQLADQTGQYIDLYGNAYFEDTNLHLLEDVLTTVCQQVENQPGTWHVSIGFQTHPEYKEVFEEVNRAIFLQMLNQWNSLVKLAQQRNHGIVCWGD